MTYYTKCRSNTRSLPRETSLIIIIIGMTNPLPAQESFLSSSRTSCPVAKVESTASARGLSPRSVGAGPKGCRVWEGMRQSWCIGAGRRRRCERAVAQAECVALIDHARSLQECRQKTTERHHDAQRRPSPFRSSVAGLLRHSAGRTTAACSHGSSRSSHTVNDQRPAPGGLAATAERGRRPAHGRRRASSRQGNARRNVYVRRGVRGVGLTIDNVSISR